MIGDDVAIINAEVLVPDILPMELIALVKYPKGAFVFMSSLSVMN